MWTLRGHVDVRIDFGSTKKGKHKEEEWMGEGGEERNELDRNDGGEERKERDHNQLLTKQYYDKT